MVCPVGTVELADCLGLHPNGVRLHLERLERDGLLVRATAPQPRRRPRDSWQIAPGRTRVAMRRAPTGTWCAGSLARWDPAHAGLKGIESAGRDINGQTPRVRTAQASTRSRLALTRALGFQPLAELHPDGGVALTLRNCPYRDAVRENPPAICGFHRGITRGLLDTLAPKAKLTNFEPHDPDLAGCLIEAEGMAAPSSGK